MGMFGLLLAGVGIYGVAAFAASRRAREVAIRMALGATDRDVTRLLIRSGARAPLAGLLTGLGLGVPLSIGAATVIPGVRVADPAAFSVVAAVIVTLSSMALLLPVRGLLRRTPMRRLREE
jgi:ABC-type antimicrobial peptide transport system permease subunit